MRIFVACFFCLCCFLSCSSPSQQAASVSADSLTFRQRMTDLQKLYADPNSPYRDEVIAIKVYDNILSSPYYSSAEKMAVQRKLQMALQNRVGQQANDFTYYDPTDTAKSLYILKADYTLLYFFNPECNACKEMTAALVSSSFLSQSIKTGKVKLLAIYPDRDIDLWKRYLPQLPKEWLYGRDDQEYLWKNKVYDLRAIPTLYLLDKDKKVLLKDCLTIDEVEKKIAE